ncbi:MAG TPA: hypothetical protein VJL29_02920 [Thermoguttaceae bacterium]|nr:hypothetical protein [Thermoguttaceae bacterium]
MTIFELIFIIGMVTAFTILAMGPKSRKPTLLALGILAGAAGAVVLARSGLLAFVERPSSWFAIGFLAIIALAIGSVAALIANPKTRPWGIGLLVVPVVLIVVLPLVGVLSYRHASHDFSWQQNQERMRRDEATTQLREMGEVFVSDHQPAVGMEPRRPGRDPAKETAKDSPKPPEPVATSVETAPKTSTTKKIAPTDNRPAWIDAEPGMVGGAYHCTATVGPYTTRIECDRALPNELRRAVAEYVDLYLGPEAKYRRQVQLPDDYVTQNVVKATWEETRQTTVGPMKLLHVLLAFDQKTFALIKNEHDRIRAEERMLQAALALGGVLAVLLIAFAVVKTDVVTKGAYRQYMWLAVGAAVLTMCFGSIVLAAPGYEKMSVFLTGGVTLGGPGIALTIMKKTRRFGLALLAALFLGSLTLLAIGEKAW